MKAYGRSIDIYKLYWDECKYFYIGRSCGVESRYKGHIKSLTDNKHSNKKLQKIYLKHGNPLIEVLETCTDRNMKKKEAFYIHSLYNSEYTCNKYPSTYYKRPRIN